jgi:hypothetical protein
MSSAELALTGGLSLGDNVKAKFGDSDDLQIYHDGTDSLIKDIAQGNLVLTSDGTGVMIRNHAETKTMANFNTNGSVQLRHDNSTKFETTSTGIDVTGSVTCDGFTSTGIDDNATSTAITIDASENVTVGGILSAQSAVTTSKRLFLVDNAGTSMHNALGVYVGETDRLVTLSAEYGNSIMAFRTDGAERMRIDSAGNVGIGTNTLNSNKAVIEGGVAGINSSTLALKTGDGANSKVADLAFYGTFVTPTSDQGQRRTADITSGFSTANWGTEYLAFGVGAGGTINDAANVTSEKMRIDSAGRVTMPYQPAFNARSNYASNTGPSGTQIFATVETNIGGHFSAATGRFTAPVSGMYHFSGTVLSRGGAYIRLDFQKNNVNVRYSEQTRSTTQYSSATSTISIYLNATDYVSVTSGPYDTYGAAYNYFSGHLIG